MCSHLFPRSSSCKIKLSEPILIKNPRGPASSKTVRSSDTSQSCSGCEKHGVQRLSLCGRSYQAHSRLFRALLAAQLKQHEGQGHSTKVQMKQSSRDTPAVSADLISFCSLKAKVVHNECEIFQDGQNFLVKVLEHGLETEELASL